MEHNKKDQGKFTSNNSQHDVNVKQIVKDDAYKHNTAQKCFFCGTGQPSKYLIFDENEYGNNPFLEQIRYNHSNIPQNSIICYKCHKSIISESYVECVMCETETQRKQTCV